MKRSRFSEEQIISILKEHQASISAAELCRKYGVSDATFYKWRSKYGDMEVSEIKQLMALEEENAKLKKLLAESMIDVWKCQRSFALLFSDDGSLGLILLLVERCHTHVFSAGPFTGRNVPEACRGQVQA